MGDKPPESSNYDKIKMAVAFLWVMGLFLQPWGWFDEHLKYVLLGAWLMLCVIAAIITFIERHR
jgi:hypothetical protein